MTDTYRKFSSITSMQVNSLHGLGNGSWWQSAAIDNSSGHLQLEVFAVIETTTTAGSDATVDFYLGAQDSGDNYEGGLSGTEGTWTPVANNEELLSLMEGIPIDSTETTARLFTKRIVFDDPPLNCAIAAENNLGTALGVNSMYIGYKLNHYVSA